MRPPSVFSTCSSVLSSPKGHHQPTTQMLIQLFPCAPMAQPLRSKMMSGRKMTSAFAVECPVASSWYGPALFPAVSPALPREELKPCHYPEAKFYLAFGQLAI